jgi:hypothetical protein
MSVWIKGDFFLLKEFLSFIDKKLEESWQSYQVSKNEGALDTGEYYAGFGFIAIQRYIHAAYPYTFPNNKHQSLKLNNGLMEILNAGADFAKHSDEWWPLDQKLSKQSQKTVDTFFGEDDLSPYPCVNKLYSLTKQMSFLPLMKEIEEWQVALDKTDHSAK